MQSRNPVSISIVIPAYNEGRALRRCLDTIAAQTVLPDEVIVVDNNSTDDTVQSAVGYPFVRIIREPLQGIVYARNAGFDAARSSVIARIDADTLLPKDWIETLQRFYAEPAHRNVVFTGGCYFYNLWTGQVTGRIYDLIVHHVNRMLIGYYFPWGSNCAIPAEAWRAVRRNVCGRTDIHEDLDIGLHLQRAHIRTIYRSRIRVGARARRLTSDHEDLWRYVMMWPHTLRRHNIDSWPLAWVFALGVWIGSYSVILAEYAYRRVKHRMYPPATEIEL